MEPRDPMEIKTHKAKMPTTSIKRKEFIKKYLKITRNMRVARSQVSVKREKMNGGVICSVKNINAKNK